LDYGKRIDRPYFQELNPFISPLDKYTFYGGNPFLTPQYSHNIQLSYVYKGFWTTNFTYQFLKDIFGETIEIDANNNFYYFSRPKNLSQRTLWSLSTNLTVKPVKTWTCITNAEITNLHYQGKPYTETIDTAGTFVFLNVVNQFALGRGWSAELTGWYRSAITTSQVVTLPQGQISAGFQKKILQNKGNLKFNISDIFYTRINGGSINFLQRTESSYTNYMDTRVATLSFSYNFSKGATAKGNRKTGGAEEENNRVKN
jgi:Outer membrane protein beta-barrel family